MLTARVGRLYDQRSSGVDAPVICGFPSGRSVSYSGGYLQVTKTSTADYGGSKKGRGSVRLNCSEILVLRLLFITNVFQFQPKIAGSIGKHDFREDDIRPNPI